MAETWQKVTVDGQEVIEVTATNVSTRDYKRVEDDIRHIEMRIAMLEGQLVAEKAALVVAKAQIATLPKPKPVEVVVEEPIEEPEP